MQIKMCVDNTLGSRGNGYKTGHVIFLTCQSDVPLKFFKQTTASKSHFYYFLHKIRSTSKINTEWIISTNFAKRFEQLYNDTEKVRHPFSKTVIPCKNQETILCWRTAMDRRLKTGDPHRVRFQRCHFRRQTRLVLKQNGG